MCGRAPPPPLVCQPLSVSIVKKVGINRSVELVSSCSACTLVCVFVFVCINEHIMVRACVLLLKKQLYLIFFSSIQLTSSVFLRIVKTQIGLINLFFCFCFFFSFALSSHQTHVLQEAFILVLTSKRLDTDSKIKQMSCLYCQHPKVLCTRS